MSGLYLFYRTGLDAAADALTQKSERYNVNPTLFLLVCCAFGGAWLVHGLHGGTHRTIGPRQSIGATHKTNATGRIYSAEVGYLFAIK